MRSLLMSVAAAAGLLLGGPAWAQDPALSPAVAPTRSAEEWRAAAAQDLTAIHDILRDNSPAMVVDRDSAHFRAWLETGLAQARADLPKVKDGRGYFEIIRGYVVGFRDSHIQWGPNDNAGISMRAFAWPGFVLGWQTGGYEVAYRASDAPDAPPVHARLVSCDGQDAKAIAAMQDRYEGNFSLPGGRIGGAVRLLLDRGNPFVTLPTSCVFTVDGARRTYALTWRPYDKARTAEVEAALGAHRAEPKLDVAPWGDRRWWITIPSMRSGPGWPGFYDKVRANLAAIRGADVVVIDVRGNGGGNSDFSDRLAKMLWGEDLVAAREPDLGPTVWRASKLNRQDWADAVERIGKDGNFDAGEIAWFRSILARYDQALAKGEPTFTLEEDAKTRPPAPSNPMRGRVLVLTDYACNSACLDLMDEFMAMPGVRQAGTVTSADTIFMDLSQAPKLPSGLSGLAFGRKAWIKRPRGSNVPYTPSPQLTWTGRDDDEAGLRSWLASVTSR